MDFLKNIIKDVLNEDTVKMDVLDAIKNRYEVEITYKADRNNGEGLGKRNIQPVAFGTSFAGNPVIRAYQTHGDAKHKDESGKRKTHGWKFFKLSNIVEWKPQKRRKFPEPPPDSWRIDGEYNKSGDNSMDPSYPIVVADFENTKARYERGGLKKYNAQRQQQKQEEDPLYSLKKNIEKNKSNSGYDYITNNVQNSKYEVPSNIDIDKQNNDYEEEYLKWYLQQQKKRNNKGSYGNQTSSNDMEQLSNFPEDTVMTNGPIRKGGENVKVIDNDKTLDYSNIEANGPIYKGEEMNNNDTEEEMNNI